MNYFLEFKHLYRVQIFIVFEIKQLFIGNTTKKLIIFEII